MKVIGHPDWIIQTDCLAESFGTCLTRAALKDFYGGQSGSTSQAANATMIDSDNAALAPGNANFGIRLE